MEVTLQAIVLKRKDAGESDRRITVLSRESGKLDIIAKGARKAASRLAGVSDPLSQATFSIAAGKKNRFITQAQPISSFRGLRRDYERLTTALTLCELYAAVIPWEEPIPEAFDLLIRSLEALENHPKPYVALIWSQIQLMQLAGFMPQFECCVVSDRAITESKPFVSPSAGGYVSDAAANDFRDRFRTRVEVLYGLAKLPALSDPPPNFKFVEEALADLLPFWRAIAEAPLPANESAIAELRHAAEP